MGSVPNKQCMSYTAHVEVLAIHVTALLGYVILLYWMAAYCGIHRPTYSKKCPRLLPQGRAAVQKCTYKGSISVSLPPPFSLSHPHISLFSSHLKRLPKDRSQKMNRSQRVSWQRRAVAHKHKPVRKSYNEHPNNGVSHPLKQCF